MMADALNEMQMTELGLLCGQEVHYVCENNAGKDCR